MFSGFFGRSNNIAKPPAKEVADTLGLEVIEADPDTAWGLWDSALAKQDSKFQDDGSVAEHSTAELSTVPLPTLDGDIGNAPTHPMDLERLTSEQRKNSALQVVELHHQRIAKTIRTLWGDKECSVYINKLIMNGSDGMGHARIGFNHHAVEAMLVLADIHDATYGAAVDPGFGFAGTTRGTGWDKLR